MKTLKVLAIGLCGFLLSVAPAHATLLLAGTFGGVNFCATDNNTACGFGIQLVDTNALTGTLELADVTVGGLLVHGSIQTQQIGPNNVLNTSSLSVINGTGGTISGGMSVGGTNFLGPVTEAFASGSGVWQTAQGSSITLTWYNDPTNQQGADFALDRPGNLLTTYTDIANGPADAFATGALGPFLVNDPSLFGMTLGVDFSLIAGGQLLNRGQTEIKPLSAVPEPASMILLGSGLAGLVAKRRRRQALVA